jgi:hypothetical protein
VTRDEPPVQEDEDEVPPPAGHVQPTGPGPIVVLGLLGLFLGWAWRGIRIRSGDPAPDVTWLAVGVAFFVAAIVGATAWATWRTVRRDRRLLTAQQGVARLVLGKTMCRIGAFGAGAYLGIAISYVGVAGDAADTALLRALAAAIGAGLTTGAGLLLEHACRVPRGDA